jgi:DNA-binding transcriptional ArsR family regulator
MFGRFTMSTETLPLEKPTEALIAKPSDQATQDEATVVFERAAELFSLMGSPMRLRILSALCDQERSVSQLLERIGTTQPNLSQHLNVLYQSGIVAKRKEGTQVYYRVQSEKAVTLCRSVCTQVAIELDEPMQLPASERLLARV